MIPLSELRVIEDTFFKADLTYYKPSIYPLLDKHFKEENDYSQATLIKLKNFVKTSNMAYKVLLEKDIAVLQEDIRTIPKQFDEQLWRDMLPRIREQVKKYLGLEFKPRSIFFEDSFPRGLEGFEKKGASSVTIFEGNEGAGIYFLNKRVSSFFTPLLMIHEQLHSCLSQNKSKDQMYIEWFEEGLCQWYSMKIYHSLTDNINVLELFKERSYIYSQTKDEHNFTKRYYEYMKLFSRLFLHGGHKLIGSMLVNYLSNERDYINSYLDNPLPMQHTPKDELENFLARFSSVVEPEKVSPVEFLILQSAAEPKKVEQIASETRVPQDTLKKLLIGLHFKGMVVLKEGGAEINWRKKDLFDKGLIRPYWPIEG